MEVTALERPKLNPALIEKASQAEQLLASKIEAFKKLDINGLDDKEGYAAVKAARLELKKIRVDIEKAFKADRDTMNAFVKANLSKEKELMSLISPMEEALAAKEKAVDDEKERIRQEEIRKEEEKMKGRADEFAKYDYAVDHIILKGWTDEVYESELTRVKNLWETEQNQKEQARLAEEQKKKEDEERLARVAAEQKAEQKRLEEEAAKLKAEQDRMKKEQEEREAALKAEREKLEAERKAIEDAKRKQEEERQRKEREEKIKLDAEAKAKADAEAKLKAEQEKKEREEKEKKRQEELRPDKEKLQAFAYGLMNNAKVPACSSNEAKAIVESAKYMLDKIAKYVNDKAITL